MEPFQKRVTNCQQKWYHFKKGSKILDKNGIISVRKKVIIPRRKGTISEKGQNSSTKMEPFQKRVTNCQQKWCHFRKGSKFLNKNCTISEEGQQSLTKMVPFQSEKSQNSSIKMVPFQKRVKNPQRKWYHFRKGSKSTTKMVPFQKRVKNILDSTKMVLFWSEKGQKSSTKKCHFRKESTFLNNHFRRGSKIVNKNGTISEKCHLASENFNCINFHMKCYLIPKFE